MSKILELIPGLGEEATVTRFAELTGKTKSAISDHKNKGLLKQGDSFIQWLHSYMAHLSDMAGGRGGDKQEQLTEARIADLETKAGLNRLAYHEKLENLVPVEIASASLVDWAGYTNREIVGSFDQLIHEVEHKHGITVDPEVREKIVGSAINRIREYAEKLGSSLTGGG